MFPSSKPPWGLIRGGAYLQKLFLGGGFSEGWGLIRAWGLIRGSTVCKFIGSQDIQKGHFMNLFRFQFGFFIYYYCACLCVIQQLIGISLVYVNPAHE